MNIVLLGMPLVGKTTIGRMISEELSLPHIDLDEKIEKNHGDNIYNLFIRLGEKQFRYIENVHLKQINMNNSHVLSLGGGAANEMNRDIISLYSHRIWLQCSMAEIEKRGYEDRVKRPLLYNTNNLIERLYDLYKERKFYFSSLSNFKIDTDTIEINQTVQSILRNINE